MIFYICTKYLFACEIISKVLIQKK